MTTALVLGGARCVWRDAARALDLFTPDYVVACKDIGADWPGHIDVWVSLHPEKTHVWQIRRERARLNTDYVAVTHMSAHMRYPCRTDVRLVHVWKGMPCSGGSGFFGVKAAIEMCRADRIVLAGIPMQGEEGHYFNDKPWRDPHLFIPAWKSMIPRLKDSVRSMSGWTRETFGEPTREWLA